MQFINMMVHACTAGIWRQKQDSGFEASLGSTVSDTLSQKRIENLGIMAHTCNPSTQEKEAGEWGVQVSLSYIESSVQSGIQKIQTK